MKKLLLIASVVLAMAMLNKVSYAQLIEWQISQGGNGHFYGLTEAGCWTDTEAFAVSQGGHLVTIDDATENEFLRTTFLTISGSQEDFWIGLQSPSGDWIEPATWTWISGSTSTFRNWRPDQPDLGSADGEDDRFAALNFPRNSDGGWDNFPNCAFRQPRGIFELLPEPVVLDHFKCYKAKGDAVDVAVDLQDQFGTESDVLIGKPKRFCTPVDKNGEGISDPMAHLTCYKIKGSEEAREVVIENQFGRQVFEIGKTKTLCVPSEQLDVILKEEDSDEN